LPEAATSENERNKHRSLRKRLCVIPGIASFIKQFWMLVKPHVGKLAYDASYGKLAYDANYCRLTE
jgi:hypothetical protein